MSSTPTFIYSSFSSVIFFNSASIFSLSLTQLSFLRLHIASSISRPQLDKFIEAAKKGKFSVLIIFDVTRLGRNTKHLVNSIDLFRKLNVRPIFIKEAIDFTNESTSILLFEILAVLSSFERRLIGERVKEALRIKKAIAEQTGNGWTTERPPLEDDLKSKVIELYQQGLSIRKISQQLGSISKSSVQRLIKDYKSSDPKL